jgi:hypothetical protein
VADVVERGEHTSIRSVGVTVDVALLLVRARFAIGRAVALVRGGNARSSTILLHRVCAFPVGMLVEAQQAT